MASKHRISISITRRGNHWWLRISDGSKVMSLLISGDQAQLLSLMGVETIE